MSPLAEFLLARIAEDEAAARAIPPATARWTVLGHSTIKAELAADAYTVIEFVRIGGKTMEHVVRWDPVRVLAECEANRRIVEMWREYTEPEDVDDEPIAEDTPLRDLGWMEFRGGAFSAFREACQSMAVVYSDHPDYDESWRP